MQALRFNGEVRDKRESSPCESDLELGLGINGGCGTLIKEEQGQVLFTGAQIQELYLQEAVFRFLLSGLPVPIHLVFPIWNSVVTSSKVEIHRHFPSLGILFGFGYPSMMNDPEPGRCRRTDGKKWRCYQPAIPQQKYCEKHLHRGANRSRKHVEASKHALKPFVPGVSTSLDLMAPCSHSEKRARGMLEAGSSSPNDNGDWKSNGKTSGGDRNGSEKSTKLRILMAPCSHSEKRARGMLEDGSSSHNGNGDWKSEGKSSEGDKHGTEKSTKIRIPVGKCNPKDERNYSIGKSTSNFNSTNIPDANVSNLGDGGSSDTSFSPGFGVLQKSVVQHDKASICTPLNLDYKTPEEKETESQRCKRTDGRKWRCRRDVVPDKTFCETHLLRGEKRATLDSNMVIGSHVSNPKKGKPSKIENKINLNTDLSIQMSATPEKTAKGGNSSSSDTASMTDESATTISI